MAKYNNKKVFEITGVSELLKKIEKAGGDLNKSVEEAASKALDIPAKEMLDFIKRHRFTGVTEESFVKEINIDDVGVIRCEIGFKIDKTHEGLAAIFLNVGSPTNKPPSFFIDHAVDDNLDKINDAIQDALNKALKELM